MVAVTLIPRRLVLSSFLNQLKSSRTLLSPPCKVVGGVGGDLPKPSRAHRVLPAQTFQSTVPHDHIQTDLPVEQPDSVDAVDIPM